MKRVIVDYNKLTNEILSMLVEKYPDGYTDADFDIPDDSSLDDE